MAREIIKRTPSKGRMVVARSKSSLLAKGIERAVVGRGGIKKIRVEFLHTGSTPLNLAGSGGDKDGGWARGRVINLVGDGSSGKTALALELAAWCFFNIKKVKSKIFPKVKKVVIIYDNIERVMDFPLEEMYGEEFVDGVEWISSASAEGFGRSIGRTIKKYRKKGVFVLYILDSLDALMPEAALERFDKAADEDKPEESHSYAEKASYFSQSFFGNLVSKMSGQDFTLLIISQVRTKIGVVFGKKQYRTGGKGMDFYTHQVAWLGTGQELTKTIRRKKIPYGVRGRVKFERNKVAKPRREADFIILFDHGIDDYTSTVDFVHGDTKQIDYGGKKLTKEQYIARLQKDPDLFEELREEAQEIWQDMEEQVKVKRKRKYN